jgi:hypothetical protein
LVVIPSRLAAFLRWNTISLMPEVLYNNRRAVQIENDLVRVTMLVEGGHIAEILHKPSGVNPLWTPPWPSIEHSSYQRALHPEYGDDAESKLLAGIMGHNLCLDLFGPPSPEEAAAGMTTHGEASTAFYSITSEKHQLLAKAELPTAQLAFQRQLRLTPGSPVVRFRETVENLSSLDRPSSWTQHVTLGPPFLEPGSTQFLTPATLSSTRNGIQFNWPQLPQEDGTTEDLSVYPRDTVSNRVTTHVMDSRIENAFFLAFSPRMKVLFGYTWKQRDFPWLCIWDENCGREAIPWSRRTITRGLEFGVSPFPESRRNMIERNSVFDIPCYRWFPAKTRTSVEYSAFVDLSEGIQDAV